MELTYLYSYLNLKRGMIYRLNFILTVVSVMPIHMIQMVFSWFITQKFDGFANWSGWNLILLYGILLTSYSIAQIFFRELRFLENHILSGTMDIYFIRPIPILYSVIFNHLSILELFSQLVPSVVVLLISCYYNNIEWDIVRVLVLMGAVSGGSVIQMSVFLFIGCVSFWTGKSNMLASIFFSFKDFLNYPLHVYGKEVLFFLTFVFPLAFINYYPALYILEIKSSISVLSFLSIPVAIVSFCLALIMWKAALRHYNSAGS